jgi:hypothetical protein
MGALTIATMLDQQQKAGVPPEALSQFPDPGEWYAQHMKALEPALLPPPDPAAAKLAEVENAKTEAARERVQVETQAKIGIEQEHSRLKLIEIQAMHAAKMQELGADQSNKAADSATKLTLAARANASKERVEAAWMSVERKNKEEELAHQAQMAAHQSDQATRMAGIQAAQKGMEAGHQMHMKAMEGQQQERMAGIQGQQKEKVAKLQAARAKARPKRS